MDHYTDFPHLDNLPNMLSWSERILYQLRDFQADHVLQISAKNGQGLEELKELLADVLREGQIYIERLVPYDQAGSIARIRKYGQVVQEEFLAEGISVKVYVPMEVYSQI